MTELTSRGFARVRFTDLGGTACSVQASSLATEAAIWLGADEIGLQRFVPYQGWSDVPTPSSVDGEQHVANNRMHLTREQVARLLPVLEHFVATGEVADDIPVAKPVAWMRRWAFDAVDVMAMRRADRPEGWALHATTQSALLPGDVPLYAFRPPASALLAAVADLLTHRVGTLPTRSDLRNNDKSRAALDVLAREFEKETNSAG